MKSLCSTLIRAIKTERKLAKKVLMEKKNTAARLKRLSRAKGNVNSFFIYRHCFVTLGREVCKLLPKQAVKNLPFLESGRPLEGWMAAWLRAWLHLSWLTWAKAGSALTTCWANCFILFWVLFETMKPSWYNKYPYTLQATSYNFSGTGTSCKTCAGIVKATPLHSKNPAYLLKDAWVCSIGVEMRACLVIADRILFPSLSCKASRPCKMLLTSPVLSCISLWILFLFFCRWLLQDPYSL